jgi:hypothetical protein
VDLLAERIGDLHLLEAFLERLVEPHRGRDPELAAVGAGAADHVSDAEGAGIAEVELPQADPEVIEGLGPEPAQHEVLLDRGAGVAAREVAHDLGEATELVGGEVAARHLDGRGDEPLLALGRDIRLDPGLELALVAVR